MKVGEKIKELRESRGLTQTQLADAVGMAVGSLRDLEQGRRDNPTWGTMQRLFTALGCTCQDFIGTGVDSPPPPVRPRGKLK